MTFFRRCLALAALTLAQIPGGGAGAADNVWTPLPVVDADGIPYKLFLSPDPAVSYSGGVLDLQRSDDGGRHWSPLQLPIAGGEVLVDPRDAETLFVPTYNYLLRSTDGGRSWTVSWHDPDSGAPVVLLSRHFPGRAYLATHLSIFESSDGGATFVPRGDLPARPSAYNVTLAEAADGGLYLRLADSCGMHGCGPDWGVYRSADRGRSWILLQESGPETYRIESALAHPTRPETVYFVQNRSGARLLRSEDRGATFTDLGAIPGFELHTDAASPDALYLAGRRSLHRSLDRGATWQELALPVEPDGLDYVTFALASPGQVAIYGIGYFSAAPPHAAAYRSADGGVTWSAIPVAGRYLENVSGLAVAGPEGVLYTHGYSPAIRRSADGGASWESFPMSAILDDLTGDPLDPDTLYASGFIDGSPGILRSRDGGRSFAVVADTDPYVLQILAFPRGGATTVVAAFGYGGQIARSADGGESWIVGPPQTGIPAVTGLYGLAWDGQALYATSTEYGGDLFRSTDGGASWQRRELLSGKVAAGGGLLARLAYPNLIESSTAGGPPWQTYALPFPLIVGGYSSLRLEVDPHGVFYLHEGDVLLRSRDRGRSWQALSQDLPLDTLTAHFAFDPQDAARVYLGTTNGLYEGRFAQQPLALLRGRFEARLRWRSAPGAPWVEGVGAALADQSGVFRLFSPERAEVAVQILDGRWLGGRFWVFVASMTDVELELEVKDRLEGDVWRHHQPAGEPQSLADLEAFPRLPQPTGGTLPQPFGGLEEPRDSVLLMSRFAVEVQRPGSGEPIRAAGQQLFGDTAGFTFFVPGYTDLVVNVIDGRALNGKFWVFGGSLTDQEFTLRIEDLQTGAVWTRHNTPGSFAGFGDTAAF